MNVKFIKNENYKELIIWQRGIEIVKKVCILSRQFPNEESLEWLPKLREPQFSISANIAEGSRRNSDKDYARFLQLSLGSAFEIQTYLIIAKD